MLREEDIYAGKKADTAEFGVCGASISAPREENSRRQELSLKESSHSKSLVMNLKLPVQTLACVNSSHFCPLREKHPII